MSITTRAAVLPAPRSPVEIREVEVPVPGPREVLVRMEACGICHSDIFVSGLMKLPHSPLVLGHEGIGRVEQTGSEVTGLHTGDRVGITFLGSTCGDCLCCNSGRERFCSKQKNSGYSIDGVLAGYAVADAGQVIRMTGDLAPEHLAPLCCAGWTAYGALREAALCPGRNLAIYGYGGLGQLALQYALRQKLNVAVADVSDRKLEYAKRDGAHSIVRAEDGGRKLRKQMGGVDAAIVFTGSPDAMDQALKSVKSGGLVVLVGLTTRDLPLSITDIILKGIRIVGSFLGTREDMQAVLRLAAENNILPAVETFPLDAAPVLLERLRNGEIGGRAVVTFPS